MPKVKAHRLNPNPIDASATVTQIVNTVTLTITAEQAVHLYNVTGNIGGIGPTRCTITAVYEALEDVLPESLKACPNPFEGECPSLRKGA